LFFILTHDRCIFLGQLENNGKLIRYLEKRSVSQSTEKQRN